MQYLYTVYTYIKLLNAVSLYSVYVYQELDILCFIYYELL